MRTEVGYTGGLNSKPTYGSVCGGDGHTEAIRVDFNPEVISYRDILDQFWELHDPTVPAYTQYKSAIWPQNEEQARIAAEVVAKRSAEQETKGGRPIFTGIEPSSTFYAAEGYHQNYKAKNKARMALFALYVASGFLPPNSFPFQSEVLMLINAALVISFLPQLVSMFDRFL